MQKAESCDYFSKTYRTEILINCSNEGVGEKKKRQPTSVCILLPLAAACFTMAALKLGLSTSRACCPRLKGLQQEPCCTFCLLIFHEFLHVKKSKREVLPYHILYWSAVLWNLRKKHYLNIALTKARYFENHPHHQQLLTQQPAMRRWWGEEQKVTNTEVLKANSKNTRKLFENVLCICLQ